MSNLIDITHTVKASAAPSEGARYMFDPVIDKRFWVDAVDLIPVPVEEPPPPPPEPETPPEMPTEPEPAPEPEVPRKTKKLHHG